MTATRKTMKQQTKDRATHDTRMFLTAMRSQPDIDEVQSLAAEARRLLTLCSKLRNSLHEGYTLPLDWNVQEHDLAVTYCQIRSYQNALLRMLGEQMITSYPQWVYRWLK